MRKIAKRCLASVLALIMASSLALPSAFADEISQNGHNEETVTLNQQQVSERNKENQNSSEDEVTVESKLNNEYSKSGSNLKYLFGSNRFKTAVKVSQEGWPSGSDNVVIVNSKDTIMGIIATPLATTYNAPILMTEGNKLIGDIGNELKRLNPKNIYLIGDRSLISKHVSDSIKSKTGANIVRIFGKYPGEISAAVARNIAKVKKVDTAYIVSNENGVADALTIASKAGETKNPVIVASKNYVNQDAYNFLNDNVYNAYYIGGTSSISGSLVKKIDSIVKNAGESNRIYGSTRHSTNVNVVNRFYKDTELPAVVITKSDNVGLIDTVSAGPLAAGLKAPIVITEKNILPDVTGKLLDSRKTANIYQVGGGISSSVTNSILSKLANAVNTVMPNPQPVKPEQQQKPDTETKPDNVVTPQPVKPDSSINAPVSTSIKGKKIVIDPGHGGQDTGAVGIKGVLEKNWTLTTALATADYLKKAGANVVMTRNSDVYPTLPDRSNLSNAENADFFCSIHYNKGGDVVNSSTGEQSGTGVEVYKGEGNFANNVARKVLNSVLSVFGLRNRGVKDGTHLYVIRNTNAPAILIEGGFVSNSKDVGLLNNVQSLKKMGIQIAKGIVAAFEGK